MYRKLDEAALGTILEAGIAEFARCGFQPASVASVAKNAGVSVGVIYKYFGDKDAFFLACVRHSLELLDATLQEAAAGGGPRCGCRGSFLHSSASRAATRAITRCTTRSPPAAAGSMPERLPARSNRARRRFIRACLTARSRAASLQSGSSRSCLRFSLTIC